MPDELVSLTGREGIHRVYRDLKEAGEKDLQRELTKSIRLATKPAKDAAKASALAVLPHRGGLARLIASSRVTNLVKKGSRSAGVQIKAASGHDIKSMDEGRLRHLTFGHKPWVQQAVTPGWFTTPIAALAPDITKSIDEALAVTAAKIAGKKVAT